MIHLVLKIPHLNEAQIKIIIIIEVEIFLISYENLAVAKFLKMVLPYVYDRSTVLGK